MLTIRRARPEDLTELGKMAGELVRMHHRTDQNRFFLPEDVEKGYEWWLEREMRRQGAIVLVAEQDSPEAGLSALAGYGYGTLEERNWNMLLDEHGAIHDIFVRESARKHGLGRKLMEAMQSEFEALGAARIVLSTMVQNEAAQRLFTACGFRPTMLEMTRDGSKRL